MSFRPHNRFTIFDMLEAKGAFRSNPANAGAMAEDGTGLYTGPVEFPKMVYHPKGEYRISQEAVEVISTPRGPIAVGEQRELIYKIVKNEEELVAALAEGWHEHPAESIGASGAVPPPMGQAAEIKQLSKEKAQLEAELAELRQQRDAAKAAAPPEALSTKLAKAS